MIGALALSSTPWAAARWLVIAPHADDETLGAAALIRTTAREHRLAGVAFLTDGAGSHPHKDARSRARLIAQRQSEARTALRRLAGDRGGAPVFLGWPDAEPAAPGEPRFEAAARRLAWFCRQRMVDAIAVTALNEPHCDHAAAAKLARAVVQRAIRRVHLFEYVVWGAAPQAAQLRLSTPMLKGGARAHALSAHRSQRTPLFGAGFRLEGGGDNRDSADQLYRVRV
ncbi:PIG-L deacetylase family protein [Brevundimonas sp.]|jgi:LmbE family N-acetylglucosaminyl deacetylase|uniref:PIG-L deacetylase family protein n=1 Tax=Brevundimonas sp. TaxID=1871086 RepID=UPI0037C151E0